MSAKDALGRELHLSRIGSVDSPRVGDVWVVATDGEDRGAVLVVAVDGSLVSVWPLTASGGNASHPAFPVTVDGSGVFDVWPQARFTLSVAALGRRIGRPLDLDTVRLVERGVVDDGEALPVPAHPVISTDAQWDDLDAVCLSGWQLGEWEWPSRTSGGVFDSSRLTKAGVDARSLARLLGVTPKKASALYSGESVPTSQQIESLLASLDAANSAVDPLRKPSGPEADEMVHPRFKERIAQVSAALHISESAARNLVWEAAITTAARQSIHEDPQLAAQERVRDAIDRLLSDTQGD